MDRPNILYVVTHDTGRFLGCYGRPIPFSPNLDRFAAEGVRFSRAYCSAPCCGPSRNCAMTGKYRHVTG
ncbi:MAG: sulfatase-like hydrolase/transferase, partial [Candidatus Brocadiaceae bacterium]